MTVTLRVRHKTIYRYHRPVLPGEHRLMSRPRGSHDLRLIDTGLTITPAPAKLRWVHDVFGNSIAIVSFAEPAAELVFESTFCAEHFPMPQQTILVEAYAERLPFLYSDDEAIDLGQTRLPHYADPQQRISSWAQGVAGTIADRNSLAVLTAMTAAIRNQLTYQRREEMGVQAPLETLERGSGSCRDFAVLMMEAARSLGLAAQFVSGYLYDERLVGAQGRLAGSGSTHAWVQVYLPGAGWVEFDPTNTLVGGRNLIRVAIAREASQAAPLTGSFAGTAADFHSLTVDVQVTAE